VPSASLPRGLLETLREVAKAARSNVDDWWIIAGAAAALHGVTEIPVNDVDVLMSVRDADVVLKAIGVTPVPTTGNAHFRSTLFGQWHGLPLTVEIMAGFDYMDGHSWTRVAPTTRQLVALEDFAVFVPDRAELAALFRAFGRQKDQERARRLERI
jgi:hypothetical protein